MPILRRARAKHALRSALRTTSTALLLAGLTGCDSEAPTAPRITASTPASPSKETNPSFKGEAEALSTVRLFAGACSGTPLGSGPAAAFSADGLQVTVPANATTLVVADATDAAGNVSPCSTPFEYTHDALQPAAATIDASTPASPSSDPSPTLEGRAEAGTTVTLYADAACVTAVGSGKAGADGSFAVAAQLTANALTRLFVIVSDATGNASGCGDTGFTYEHDDKAPEVPVFGASHPASPANENAPVLVGTAEAGSTIRVHVGIGCDGEPVVTAVAAEGAFEATVSVADDTTTRYTATATDAAGNRSACTAAPFVFVEDSQAPVAPVLAALAPASPANAASTVVQGTAEAGARVVVFASAACEGAEHASGVAADGAFAIEATVARNAVTTFSARAIDAAGNEGPCSTTSLSFREDSIPPAIPTLGSLTPTPTSANVAIAAGEAEDGATVILYADTACTEELARGAAGESGYSIEVTVDDDTTTTLHALAKDAAGNASACSTESLTLVEDSSAPSAPVLSAVSPSSPTKGNAGTVTGTAEAGADVQLYANDTCTETVGALVRADEAGAFSAAFTVPDDTTTRLFATATDAAGNASPCSTTSLVLVEDSRAPTAPEVAQVTPSTPTKDNAGVLAGTTEPYATVALYTDAGCTLELGFAGPADAAGDYAIAFRVDDDTTTTLYAAASDAAGNRSDCSLTSATFVEDSTAPGKAGITSLEPASPANENRPIASGDAEPGATVSLYKTPDCSGTPLATVPAGEDGTFRVPFTVADDSTTTLRALAVDAAGNVSACPGGGVTYVEDSVTPAMPTITGTTPAGPANVVGRVDVVGTAEPGATVRVHLGAGCGDTPAGVAVAAVDGSFVASVPVGDDTVNTFHATATDPAGNRTDCTSGGFTFVEDSTTPATPAMAATDPASPAKSTTPSITGSAEPGSTVRLFASSTCAGNAAASGTATAEGTFALTLSVANDAPTTVTAQVVDAAGNASACSEAVTYVADNTAPARPAITGTTPASPSPATSPTVNGTAEAGAMVTLYTTSNCTGTPRGTMVATGGAFALTVTPALSPNSTTTFFVAATDAAGNVSPCSAGRTFVSDGSAPATPVITKSNPTSPSKSSTTPVLSGTADPGTTVKIFTTSDCTGTPVRTLSAAPTPWSGSVTVAANSTTVFYASSTDAASNVSTCSAGFTYRHDAIAPAAPSLTATEPPSNSNNAAPRVLGTAEAGSTVRLFRTTNCTGTLAGTVTADGTGAFAQQVTVTLGTNSFTATATDAAGNVSACSSVRTYAYDNVAPPAPVLTATTPTSPSKASTTPTVTGTGETGATIKVYAAAGCSGAVAGTGVVSAGSFSVQVTLGANTTSTLSATATDVAGNASACSAATLTYVHDNTPPAAPTLTGTTPASPSNASTAPVLAGTADAGTTVNVYANATCTGTALATVASGTGSFSTALTVPANSATTLAAAATDAAGNVSACSATRTYIHDTTAPTFAGAVSATAIATNQIVLTWASATDALSPPVTYEICQSGTFGECTSNFTATHTAAAGATSLTLGGLVADTRYFYVVRALDAVGNRDANVKWVTAKTMGVGTTKQVSGGSFHTCSLNSTGEVYCWGLGLSGQMGNGEFLSRTTPGRVPGLTNVKAIAVGYWHNLALLDDGRVFAWGNNAEGELGDGTSVSKATPVQVPGIIARAVAANANSSCALLVGGTVKCWGDNPYGQLGDGTATRRLAPTAVPALDQVASLHAGARHFCAVLANRTVKCWGLNAAGQLGDGTQVNRASPTAIPFLTNVREVGGGHSHACAVLFDGSVRCWGRNDLGQLGDGTTTGRNNHMPVSGLSGALSVVAGYHQTCALLAANGAVRCWGYNAAGSVGDGTNTNRTTPVAVSGLPSATQISAGDNSCAVLSNGGARCWGENTSGQLGNGTTTNTKVPVTPTGLVDVASGRQLAATGRTTCGIVSDGTVRCWGQGTYGQLGNGGTAASVLPVEVSGLAGAVAITAGVDHFCALRANGGVSCWGRNHAGQIGDGTTTDAWTPASVPGVAGAKAIAAGADHSCAVVGDGTVRCWGATNIGQFGIGGTATQTPTPNPVTASFSGVTNVVQLAAGPGYTCALVADGTVRCTGFNGSGQLGFATSINGTPINYSMVPGTVTGLLNVTGLDAYTATTCASHTDGTVRCWGANPFGQLGNGTTNNSTTPVQFGTYADALGVAVGHGAVCILRGAGTVACAGNNTAGQLGNGSTTNSSTPVDVTGLTEAVGLTTGAWHGCALLSDGTTKCWGGNDNGQLGNLAPPTNRSTAVFGLAFP